MADGWLDSWLRHRKLPPTAEAARRYAMRSRHSADPYHPPMEQTLRELREASDKAERRNGRPPREWPKGSLSARQTAILKWLASLGHDVVY